MASTYLSRAVSSTGNRQTWTFSAWIKRANVSTSAFNIMTVRSGNEQEWISFDGNSIHVSRYNNSYTYRYITNRLFRDTSAWYHVVVAMDSTQSTASNRMKLYINGVQETSFSTETQISQNYNTSWNTSGFTNYIGNEGNNQNYFDGSISHVHFIDGTAYDPTAFGEYDANGVWKIKTSPSVTYGTNGFFILKDGNSVTDQSGNSNNFTVSGILTKTEDSPSNVFATWNPLSPNDSITYSYGNGVVTGSNATNYSMSCSTTLGASSGKYYWEMKYSTASGNGNECIGVANFDNYEYNQNMTQGTTGYVSLRWDGEREINGATTSNYFTPPSTGAVLMCAMDMDNGKVFFGSNGTWFGSGNPVTGANPTADILTSGTWGGILRYLSSKWECNFGNGYFADNTVSSAGTNASGNGIFEYDCPQGYTALSTKGLNL